MDRLMTRLGLSGKSFIPLLSSFACAIPGVMATRVIEDRRDRMTTILVAPLMSCSARLPVYTLLIAAFIPPMAIAGVFSLQAVTMVGLYAVGVVVAAGVAWALKRTVFKGPTPPFVMELPAYKWPSPRVVIHRMLDRGWSFVRRAGTIIVAVSIIMWALLYYPRLSEPVASQFEEQIAALESSRETVVDPGAMEELDAKVAVIEAQADAIQKRNSLLGLRGAIDRAGRAAIGLGLADRRRCHRLLSRPRSGGGDPRRDLRGWRRRGRGGRGEPASRCLARGPMAR